MRSYIIAAILLAACLLGFFVLKPKEPAYGEDPNIPTITDEQVKSAVLNVLKADPELIKTEPQPISGKQVQQAVLKVLRDNPKLIKAAAQTTSKTGGQTITPEQLEKYKDSIVSRVEWFYGTVLVLLLVFISLGTVVLELFKEGRYKKLLADKEEELKDDMDLKLTEAKNQLKQDISNEMLETNKEIFQPLAQLFVIISIYIEQQESFHTAMKTRLISIKFDARSHRLDTSIGTADIIIDSLKDEQVLNSISIEDLNAIEKHLNETECAVKKVDMNESKTLITEKIAVIQKLLHAQIVKLEGTEAATPPPDPDSD